MLCLLLCGGENGPAILFGEVIAGFAIMIFRWGREGVAPFSAKLAATVLGSRLTEARFGRS